LRTSGGRYEQRGWCGSVLGCEDTPASAAASLQQRQRCAAPLPRRLAPSTSDQQQQPAVYAPHRACRPAAGSASCCCSIPGQQQCQGRPDPTNWLRQLDLAAARRLVTAALHPCKPLPGLCSCCCCNGVGACTCVYRSQQPECWQPRCSSFTRQLQQWQAATRQLQQDQERTGRSPDRLERLGQTPRQRRTLYFEVSAPSIARRQHPPIENENNTYKLHMNLTMPPQHATGRGAVRGWQLGAWQRRSVEAAPAPLQLLHPPAPTST